MSSDASSIERAAADAIGEKPGLGILGLGADVEQLDLLRNDSTGALPDNVFRLLRQEPGGKTGPGRPKNSRNKQSDEIAKYLAHQGYLDPVEFMASLYSTPMDVFVELVRKADGGKGSKTGEIALKAINIQLSAAKSVAEYWHRKKPVDVAVSVDAMPTIVMPGLGSAANVDAADSQVRLASDMIARALANGQLQPSDLAGVSMQDGLLAIEGRIIDVGDDAGDEEAADDDDG